MSAMEEYKKVCAIVRGKEYWAVERSEVADAADAVIAELEAALVARTTPDVEPEQSETARWNAGWRARAEEECGR